MKFLIAIGSIEYSEPTLRVGMQVAKAFKASVTIVYVGPKVSAMRSSEVRLAHETMERWDLNRPGVNVLEWAFNFLADNEYISPQTIEAGFPKNILVENVKNRAELFLSGTFCPDVNLILRNGDIIAQLRQEVHMVGYDVTIIGGSQKRRMAHDLVQYIDSSILVVNKFDTNKSYRLLLPVNDSRGTQKAVRFGIRVAHTYNMPVDIVTVSRKDYFGPGYRGAAEKTAKYLSKANIDHQTDFKVGEAVEVIIREAGDDHIIVMGVSHMNPLRKFFSGSKPLKVMKECQCPILVVK